MKRCLFYLPGPVAPSSEAELNRIAAVSRYFTGDVIQTTWNNTPELHRALEHSIPGFRFHMIGDSKEFWLIRSLRQLLFFVRTGLALSRRHGKYDLVICYGLTKTAAAAYVIKLATGAKMIVDVPCNPSRAFVAEQRNPSLGVKIQYWLSQLSAKFLFRSADGIRLLYPEQLDGFFVNPRLPKRAFHEYVPVGCLRRSYADENYVMLLGFPWYRKGFDVLIKAFKQIEDAHPSLRLKIVGFMTDAEREEVERDYRQGDERIEFVKPMPWRQAMEYMAKCKFLVLASRSEAMGRVWLEAMALGKPVICSAVDGVVHYVKHEQNGLLFKSEDVSELAACMERLLSDEVLYERLANEGYRYAHEELNEYHYAEEYNRLACDVLGRE